jgi:asparagine synthase (glutamine-hydrolysing)
MGKISYLGGVLRRDLAAQLIQKINLYNISNYNKLSINLDHDTLFLTTASGQPHISTIDAVTILIRGYTVPSGAGRVVQAARAAEAIAHHYREHDDLPIDRFDGSFTLTVLDHSRGRILLYRNLVGNGFTYYAEYRGGLIFGSNLAELVAELSSIGWEAGPNHDVLPVLFLYRCIPGRETLFKGIHRLMPGEILTFADGKMVRSQRGTFGQLRTKPIPRADAVDCVEETLSRVLRDCADVCPNAANTLSGGVDSSLLQALWNRINADRHGPVPSFSVSVNHPTCRSDDDYALSAAETLGCRHTLVPVGEPYAVHLGSTIARCGEPPNHVQTAYFGRLARSLRAGGATAGLCGEGADSLFGLDIAGAYQLARAIRTLIPFASLRRLGAVLATWAGRDCLPDCFRLADCLNHPTRVDHPVNRVASFADWDLARSCFGEPAIASATAYRRRLLDQYEIGDDPLDRIHAAGFLGEAMDSASVWTTLFDAEGCQLLCPYLDSRVIALAVNLDPRDRYAFGRPKALLKQALSRHVPPEMAYRPKLGFGQPIFEWMSSNGQLRPLIADIGRYGFLDETVLAEALAHPNWFLFSLLCYDVWHKHFIEQRHASGPRNQDQSGPIVLAASPDQQ